MKIYVDDIRETPEGYIRTYSVKETITLIKTAMAYDDKIEEISLDFDAREYYSYGGDYIKILEWLEELKYVEGKEPCKLFYLHTGNPVGRERMRQIIKHCGWKEKEVEWELI